MLPIPNFNWKPVIGTERGYPELNVAQSLVLSSLLPTSFLSSFLLPLSSFLFYYTLKICLMASSIQITRKCTLFLVKKKGKGKWNVNNESREIQARAKKRCLQESSRRNIPLITSDVTSWRLGNFLCLRTIFPR